MGKFPTIREWQTVTNFVRDTKPEDVALLIIQYEREIGDLKAKLNKATKAKARKAKK